jgi:AcrR family transcriptional regulator
VGYPRLMAGRQEEVVVVPTGRHGLPADVVADHQRERLLAATIAQVAKRGYRGTSVDHIVKTARVGYVAFYELFSGKEECFEAAFERIVADTRADLAEGVSSELPWPEQVCLGLRILVELIAAEPARARVTLVEAQAAGPDSFRRYDAVATEAAGKLREGRALRPKGAAPLSDTLEEALVAGVTWIIHQRLVKGEAKAVPGLLAQAIQITLSPYLGEAEAQRIAAASSAAQL